MFLTYLFIPNFPPSQRRQQPQIVNNNKYGFQKKRVLLSFFYGTAHAPNASAEACLTGWPNV